MTSHEEEIEDAPVDRTVRSTWRESDHNESILKKPNPHGKGRSFILKEGRIYEPAVEGKTNPIYSALPKQLEGADEKKVLSMATPYGLEYFKTDEGKLELKRILQVANGYQWAGKEER